MSFFRFRKPTNRARRRIIRAIRDGGRFDDVVISMGYTLQTVFVWYKLAKRGLEPYAGFIAECHAVQAERLSKQTLKGVPGAARIASHLSAVRVIGDKKPGAHEGTQPGLKEKSDTRNV